MNRMQMFEILNPCKCLFPHFKDSYILVTSKVLVTSSLHRPLHINTHLLDIYSASYGV